VVVLMGVIAFNPMLKAGYDVKLASGVITAGGTLGILIPPSVMIIVYAAVAGQSVVKLYAATMFPGFFLSLLYLIYIIGWALLNPKIAPKLSEEQTRVPVRPWIAELQRSYSARMLPAFLGAIISPARALAITAADVRVSYGLLLKNLGFALVPLVMAVGTLWGAWWYVVIYQQQGVEPPPPAAVTQQLGAGTQSAEPAEEKLQELGGASADEGKSEPETLQQMGSAELRAQIQGVPADAGPPHQFYVYFGFTCAIIGLILFYYYWTMGAEQFEVLRLLVASVMPLGILSVLVLAVILLGITTATESAAVGAAARSCWRSRPGLSTGRRPRRRCSSQRRPLRWCAGCSSGRRCSRRCSQFSAAGAARELGAVDESHADAVHDPVAGDHLHPRLAAGMDRDHRDLRADLPADAQALRHRPDPVGRAGVRESAGGVPVAAGGDVGVLSERRRAEACHAQPDLRGHDAVHADRDRLHGADVSVAGHDAVAAELSVRELTQKRDRPEHVSGRSDVSITWIPGRSAVNCGHERLQFPVRDPEADRRSEGGRRDPDSGRNRRRS
jgi:TRAP-type mannitol/chloroaromatic compound transport system permease large subunit